MCAALHKDSRGGVLAVRTDPGPWDRPIEIGESVAVQGVCLTVTEQGAGRLAFDVLLETLDKTCLGSKRPGAPLNLERALRVGDAMGGHVVTGHVDGVGHVGRIERFGRDWSMTVRCASELTDQMVVKGSVALDGVSLTLVTVEPGRFSVHVIPHTWSNTALHALREGEAVNIETDAIGKYARLGARDDPQGNRVTWERLYDAGFGS